MNKLSIQWESDNQAVFLDWDKDQRKYHIRLWDNMLSYPRCVYNEYFNYFKYAWQAFEGLTQRPEEKYNNNPEALDVCASDDHVRDGGKDVNTP
jgi:hypothetical protein